MTGFTWWYLAPAALLVLYVSCLVSLSENRFPQSSSWSWCLVALSVGAFPMFLLGVDWGRWILMILMSFLIVWFSLGSERLATRRPAMMNRFELKMQSFEQVIRNFVQAHRGLTLTALIFFTLTFRMPELFVLPDFYKQAFLSVFLSGLRFAVHEIRFSTF
jgi:hypothetical protein